VDFEIHRLNCAIWQSENDGDYHFSLGYDGDTYWTGYSGPKTKVFTHERALGILGSISAEKPFFHFDLKQLPDGYVVTPEIRALGLLSNDQQFDFISTYIYQFEAGSDFIIEIGCNAEGECLDTVQVPAEYGTDLNDRLLKATQANEHWIKARDERSTPVTLA